jgi:hypothetical protein
MHAPETHRANRPIVGLAMGACVGLIALFVFALSLLTEQHSLNLIPKMEVVGLACGLVPSSAWAARQISGGLGTRNRESLAALLKGSACIGVLSVVGLTIGSKIGIRMTRTTLAFDWGTEVGSTLLLILAVFIAAFIVGFVLFWPLHLWLRRKQAAS